MTGKLRPLWTPGRASGGSGVLVFSEAAGNIISNFDAGAYPSFSMTWTKNGTLVALTMVAGGTYVGTSNGTAFQLSGFPTDIRPTVNQVTQSFTTIDAGVGVLSRAQMSSTGALIFQRGSVLLTDLTFSSTGYTASGSKGLAATWQIVYALA